MASMNDYLANPMLGLTQTYKPLPPFALTQPEAVPNWMAPLPQRSNLYGIGGVYGPDNIDIGGGLSSLTSYGSGPAYSANGIDLADTAITSPGPGNGAGNWWDGALGTRDKQGWGGLALGGAQALGSLYMGMKQYQQAKDQLAFQKDAFNKQYAANQSLTNSRLEDRQARRVLENPNATSVADYMAKWGVK